MVNHLLKLVVVAAITASTAAVATEAQDVQLAQASKFETVRDQATDAIGSFYRSLTEPFVSDKDIDCLAKNIFYEAGSESEEGKVAVGMVTINRVQSGNYADSVCGVVKQKTILTSARTETKTVEVKGGLFERSKQVAVQQTKMVSRAVCQFSWVCSGRNIKIREDDPRWQESRRVAEELAYGGYDEYRDKYAEAMSYHAVYVNPRWKLKRLTRTGNHIFYKASGI